MLNQGGCSYNNFEYVSVLQWIVQTRGKVIIGMALRAIDINRYVCINPKRTDVTYVTFHPYMVGSVFLALRSTPNACNWCQAQAHENG